MERDVRLNASVEPTRRLSTGEFTTALVHLYRAEAARANTWRIRLDTTTNWAVVTTGVAISFALGGPESERHGVILLTSLLVTFFLLLESRRYRHYDIWQTRVHLLESDFFAPCWSRRRQPLTPTGSAYSPPTSGGPSTISPLLRRWAGGCGATMRGCL